jgi:hypothetical protein
VMVSNNGRVFLMAKYQEGKRESKGGKPNYKYLILSYNGTDSKYKQYDISLGEQFISEITFEIDPKGNLLVAGFYGNKNSNGIAGIFYTRLDADKGTIIVSKTQEFDKATLAKFMSPKKAEKNKELEDYVMRKPIVREDGGILLTGEQYYVVVVTTQTKYGTTYTYHYYYNTIIVSNVKPDGTIEWITAIPKFQHTINDDGYYSSFSLCVYKDKMFFFYNDNKKNLGITEPKKMKWMSNVKNGQAIVSVVDSKGNVSKSLLMDNKQAQHLYMRPKMSVQTSSNSIIVLGENRHDYRYGKITFE